MIWETVSVACFACDVCAPMARRNDFSSCGERISYGFLANDAIAVFIPYFLHSLRFCCILPISWGRRSVFSTVEKDIATATSFFAANWQVGLSSPEFLDFA